MKHLILSLITLSISHLSFGQLIINTNTTWSTNQVLTQPVVINQGVTLTINPGVVVSVLYIDNNNDQVGDVKIDVFGKIIALGEVCNKVSFIPYITTSNKKYWTGINISSNVNGNSLKNFILTNAQIGVNINNSNISINGGEINNCFNNGILFSGLNSNGILSNLLINSCDSEGLKVDNCGNLNFNSIPLVSDKTF